MRFPRASTCLLLGVSLLVAVGALCVVVLRLAGGGDTVAGGGAQGDTSAVARPGWLLLSAAPQGALVFGWSSWGSKDAQSCVRAYDAHGVLAWERRGVTDAIAAGLPAAVVAIPQGKRGAEQQVATTGEEPIHTVRVGPDGGSKEIAASDGDVRLLYADLHEVLFVETLFSELGVPRSSLVSVREGVFDVAGIPGNGRAEGVSVSREAGTVAVVTCQDTGNYLTWFERRPEGSWGIVRHTPTDAYYVALSADGNQAVLGPERPVVSTREGTSPLPLPVDYVAEARWGVSRLLVIDFRTVANETRTVVHVVDLGLNAIEWSREFEGERRIASDGDLTQLAYLQPDREAVVIVDLATRGERIVPVPRADDVAFVAEAVLVAVLEDGSVYTLRTR